MDSDRQAELLYRRGVARIKFMRVPSPPRYISSPWPAGSPVSEYPWINRSSLGTARSPLDYMFTATDTREQPQVDFLGRSDFKLETAQSTAYGTSSLDGCPSTKDPKLDEPKVVPGNPNHLMEDTMTKYRAGKRYLLSRRALNTRRRAKPAPKPGKEPEDRPAYPTQERQKRVQHESSLFGRSDAFLPLISGR